jgi:hypothetical protein
MRFGRLLAPVVALVIGLSLLIGSGAVLHGGNRAETAALAHSAPSVHEYDPSAARTLRGEAAAARLTDEDLRSGVRSFIDDLARRAMSDYDCDVHGLLRRVQAGPSR